VFHTLRLKILPVRVELTICYVLNLLFRWIRFKFEAGLPARHTEPIQCRAVSDGLFCGLETGGRLLFVSICSSV
jgi:hypothetical protein